jgi:hypothetical protein
MLQELVAQKACGRKKVEDSNLEMLCDELHTLPSLAVKNMGEGDVVGH